MKIGIIQPYFLPYIGYFALIKAVDKFVYFDDAQYIRRGWVNRNRIKMLNNWLYITLPIKKASLSAKINEVYIVDDQKAINKIKETIKHCYGRTKYYNVVKELIIKHIKPGRNISDLNIMLTNKICSYLNIDFEMYISSEIPKDNSLKGENKIIEICKKLKGDYYINPIGGIELYSKEKFKEFNIKLNFLKMKQFEYPQGKYGFIENLSILDVMMWNSQEKIKDMLEKYELI